MEVRQLTPNACHGCGTAIGMLGCRRRLGAAGGVVHVHSLLIWGAGVKAIVLPPSCGVLRPPVSLTAPLQRVLYRWSPCTRLHLQQSMEQHAQTMWQV